MFSNEYDNQHMATVQPENDTYLPVEALEGDSRLQFGVAD